MIIDGRCPNVKGEGKEIVQTTNAYSAAAKAVVGKKIHGLTGVRVRVSPGLPNERVLETTSNK